MWRIREFVGNSIPNSRKRHDSGQECSRVRVAGGWGDKADSHCAHTGIHQDTSAVETPALPGEGLHPTVTLRVADDRWAGQPV